MSANGMVRAAASVAAVCAMVVGGMTACAEVGTGPTEAAAIELPPFPSPSIVVGDSLRDLNGVVVSISAIVRNVKGEIIADAPVRYLYADFNRDSAIVVDSVTGFVRAVRLARGASGDGRIAARVGGALQVLRSIIVTTRPDTLGSAGDAPLLTTVLPDTARASVTPNRSEPLTVTIRHFEGTTASAVNAWPVQFRVVKPSNPTNDTTLAVFLVDDNGRASVLDTTTASGTASRRVRVRAALFPTGAAVDTVLVQVLASYRGTAIPGAPDTIAVPVKRGP